MLIPQQDDAPLPPDATETAPIPALNEELLRQQGLDPKTIALHQRRVYEALHLKIETTIPIVGACTTNNGGILSWKQATRVLSSETLPRYRQFQKNALHYWRQRHVVTCIPAAGAASRFLADFHRLVLHLERDAPLLATAYTAYKNAETTLSLSLKERRLVQDVLEVFKVKNEFYHLYDVIICRNHLGKDVRDLHKFLFQLLETGESRFRHLPPVWGPCPLETHEGRVDQGPVAFHIPAAIRWPWRLGKDAKVVAHKSHDFSHQAEWDKMEHAERDEGTAKRQWDKILKIYSAAKALLDLYACQPKALLPTTENGDTFLFLKCVEQILLFPNLGNVLIVPAQQEAVFKAKLAELEPRIRNQVLDIFSLGRAPAAPAWIRGDHKLLGEWHVYEQGCALSTIRFLHDGSPLLEKDGGKDERYSQVSAGHGELLKIFQKMSQRFPHMECLHIRNIDNVIGTSVDRSEELNIPTQIFQTTRDALEYLRYVVEEFLEAMDCPKIGQNDGTNEFLEDSEAFQVLIFLSRFTDQFQEEDIFAACVRLEDSGKILIPWQIVYTILSELFYWQPLHGHLGPKEAWSAIFEWLSRPLSVFGVVRKEVGDVGGGPVFARLPDGKTIKLCMEMPHASHTDSREYFGDRGRATHFNPALVFFETHTHKYAFLETPEEGKVVDFENLFDERFWLLSKKEHQGEPVYYHETVLYELIGNSEKTNLLFVEVPRTLFKPHKAYFDSLGQDRRSYGFENTLLVD